MITERLTTTEYGDDSKLDKLHPHHELMLSSERVSERLQIIPTLYVKVTNSGPPIWFGNCS